MEAVWAGVVRISHMGGRKVGDENVHADRDQLDAISRHAKQHGARLEVLPPELDVSGGLPLEQRPSLLRAIEGVERGEYNAIVVAYLSRLGRNVREQLRAWDRVEAAGGRIVVVQEGIDTSTPSGRLQRTVLLGIAEHERELHAERFENLRRWATEAGIWQRRQTPKGYRRDEETRHLVPDEDAAAVRQAFRDRGAGVPVVTIADRLGMTPNGVRMLLRNRVYLGELSVGAHHNLTAHPPLVDVETFERAQTHVPRPSRRKGSTEPALLAGIVRCAGCGYILSRARTAAVVYTCNGRHSGGRCPAPASVTAHLIDRHVEEIALAELGALNVNAATGQGALEDARARVAAAERELAAYMEAVSAVDVGAAAFRAGAVARQQAIDEAQAELRRQVDVQPLLPAFAGGREVWETLDGHSRNALLRALLEVVIVRRAGGRGARTPLPDRVRVVAHGTGLVSARPVAGRGGSVDPLPFPDLDDEGVLRMPGAQDRL